MFISLSTFTHLISSSASFSSFKPDLESPTDVFPILGTAHKMLIATSRESVTTRTLHSGRVYSYSCSKHMKAVEQLINGRRREGL
ncbi:Uncharacterized protein TCM_038578 [Theobroma cacao]|uniref:Uncharacterized protein n=1 Tax=Theobroma cacao TaxID=3641 RepID=A0A061GR38_THECC|nr:Uncharacterized protein TCM_038578 [Theobroma cacao]